MGCAGRLCTKVIEIAHVHWVQVGVCQVLASGSGEPQEDVEGAMSRALHLVACVAVRWYLGVLANAPTS